MFRNWPDGGLIAGLLYKQGLFDNTPGYEFIIQNFKEAGSTLHRNLSMGCTEINTGQELLF